MNKEQATFGIGGVFFGFVAGFVLAYALTAPTGASHGPTAPPRAATGAAAQDHDHEAHAGEGDPHGDVMATLEQLNERLRDNPDDVETLLELAHLYLQAGMSDQALEYLAQVEGVEPANFRGRMYQVMAHQTKGDATEVESLLEQMAADAPDRWETHYLTAVHYLTAGGDLDRGKAALGRLEDLNPELPVVEQLRQEAERLSRPAPGEDRTG